MRPPAALTQAGWRHQGRQILLQPPQRRKSRLSARPKRPRDRHRPSTRKLLAASTQNVELMSVRRSLEKSASWRPCSRRSTRPESRKSCARIATTARQTSSSPRMSPAAMALMRHGARNHHPPCTLTDARNQRPLLHPHRPAHVHSRTTSQHPVPGRQLHLIAIFAYRSLYPPCEEAHQQRVQESAEAIAELMTEYAYVSDARASRTAGTIDVALHARALARSWSQNVQLLRVTMRAWRELVGSEAAAVARERQRSYERWAQQDVEAERRHKNLEAQRIFCQGQRSAPS